ncbi:hypothetical protein PR048_012814 [Dryococelus australis]|uniref:RNA-directed DNA polymerase n=1 Tax=Dryococelus australis TaxID=614101 RepID=A0ABQ9HQH2_9NEOP|nr:hypothetical protein PR048_012814 [Dryococelus australis]
MSAKRIAQLKDAIHTSTELSVLCWIILQGWPVTIQQVPDNLRKYWSFHDALAVYKDVIFKGKRTLIPSSWKPIILSQLHCSHNGVHGTLAIARDHLFWPGITQDIISFVQKCATCQDIPKRPPNRNPSAKRLSLRDHVCMLFPTCFIIKGKNFLLVADSYSGYFDFHVLTSSTSDEVIKTLKVWFAQRGIPDELRTDGGPQYASHQFQKFSEEWNFQRRISSPHFPQSNDLSERYIQEAKNLLAKCEEDQSDIWVVLLHHRNTLRGNIDSPVKRLMGRRTKTTLLSSAKLQQPTLIKEVRQNLTTCRQIEIDRVKRNRYKPTPLQATQEILWRERHKQWVPAEVVQAVPNSRLYIIDSPRGRYRINSWFLKPLKCEVPQPAQDKDPRQGETILAPRIPPGGSFPEISESLQSTSAEPGNQGAGDNGNNSRSTSPEFRRFSHDPEHRSTPRNTYEHQMANVPRKTRSSRSSDWLLVQQTRILQVKLKGEMLWMSVMNMVLRLAPAVCDCDGDQLEVI